MLEYLLQSLKVEKVESLFPHEQTIPEHLKRLELAIKADNRLIDPLLVDRKSKVILDGNHRRNVLEKLGLDLAVCQEVDYESEVIKLGGWFPLVKI
ncbi:hypothetical protein HY570_00525, partial [Candidatus Micrarchaeota archaeon]|nr:hypothetical protein [Candidatus Micrarchaeota archaeon]